MRAIRYSLPVLLLLCSFALAQTPPQPPAQSDPARMLPAVLGAWENSMKKLESFSATDITRVVIDKTYGGPPIVYEGYAKFMKGPSGQPSRAILDLQKKGQPQKVEKFICTGTFVYEFVPPSGPKAKGVVRIHEMPKDKGPQVGDDNFLSFLFGMTAQQAMQRYNMKWVADQKDNNKWYHYIHITPRTAQDKAEFTEARLTLSSQTFLPRQLWFHQPNGNQVTWDFAKIEPNAVIPVSVFAPDLKGWEIQRMPAPGAGPNKK